MKKILIVDDEEDMVWSLQKNLGNEMEELDIFTARSAEEALELVHAVSFDLIITDIKMPGMSGIELLVQVKNISPQTGVVVMTAYPTPEYRKDALCKGCFQFIEKPFDIRDLREIVRNSLADHGFRGTVAGIELPDIIQINCISRVTAALRVRTREQEGIIYFRNGRIVHAICDDCEGEEAFYAVLSFAGGTLESMRGSETPDVTIDRGYEALLMEGMRRIDESQRSGADRIGDFDEDFVLAEAEEEAGSGPAVELNEPKTPNVKEDPMALESYLQQLKEIKGYKAAGIMNFTGEMLAYDSEDRQIDLGVVGATFNDIFRSAHEASKKIGLDACKEQVISTPKGVVVMRCSGTDAPAHFHVIGVLSSDGNQALMKMQIEKMVPGVMTELA